MRTLTLSIIAAMVSTGISLFAAEGLPVTSEAKTFRMYMTGDSIYAITSAQEIALWPVTWQKGETVTATAMDGIENALVTSATSPGSAVLPDSKGGVWTLVDSVEGTVRICVPWSVFGDGGTLAMSDALAFGVDMVADGPNRKNRDRVFPPIAYSGDDWIGDAAKAASLTFVSPNGVETTLNCMGTGAQSFTFDKTGCWTLRLTMADETVREAIISVIGGFVLLFR